MPDYLVAYDMSTITSDGVNRLRRVAKICEGYGVRVQWSVFECVISRADMVKMTAELAGVIDAVADSVRIYPLANDMRETVLKLGRNGPPDIRDPLVL